MYLKSNKKEECCGCTACEQVCPVNAISMNSDKEGFKYPIINEHVCVNCNKCEQVCSFGKNSLENVMGEKNEYPYIYGFKNKSDEIRVNSSSGGAFYAMAEQVLNNKGYVVGCAFNDKYEAVHVVIESPEEITRLQKSKYVQSDLQNVFSKIDNLLGEKRIVLFTGTACQVDGLLNYLKERRRDIKGLITCDIICHGVPSPLIFKEYLKYRSKKNKVKNVDFRYKTKRGGWSPLVLRIGMEDKIYEKTSGEDIYYRLFFGHYIVRPCCHECRYTNFNRVSDITIADFWGIEKSHPEFLDGLGISLVMVNSEKGKQLFESFKEKHITCNSNKAECIQPNLERPTPKNPNRQLFWNEFQKKGFKKAALKFGDDSLHIKIRKKIGIVLRKIPLYNLLKK